MEAKNTEFHRNSSIWYIAAAATAVRLLIALLINPPLLHDENDYFSLAHSLSQYNTFGAEGIPTGYRAPGYPFILSQLFKITGESVSAVRIFQALVDSAGCLMLIFISRRFLSDTAAVIAAGVYAFFPGNALYVSLIMSESVFISLLLAALYFLTKNERSFSNADKIIAGVLLGVLVLIRQNALVFFAIITIWDYFHNRSIRGLVRRYALVFFCSMVVIIPWSLRNKIEFDHYSLTSNGGVNFWIGHNSNASGSFRYNKLTSPLEKIQDEYQRSDYGYREGVDFMIHHPLIEVQLTFLKFARMFEPDFALQQSLEYRPEWEHYSRSIDMYKEFSPYFMILLQCMTMGIVLAGIWGMVCTDSFQQKEFSLLIFMIIGWIVSHLAFFGVARFRLPVMPLFIIVGAYGIDAWNARTLQFTTIRKLLFAGITFVLICSSIAMIGTIYLVK